MSVSECTYSFSLPLPLSSDRSHICRSRVRLRVESKVHMNCEIRRETLGEKLLSIAFRSANLRLFGCLRLRLVVGVGPTYSLHADSTRSIHRPQPHSKKRKRKEKKKKGSRSSTNDVAKPIFIFSVNSNSHPRSFPMLRLALRQLGR